MKKEKKYTVCQGKMARSGEGDFVYEEYFNNLASAKKFFNEIKNDKRGWGSFKNGEYLETFLVLNDNFDEPIDHFDTRRV